MENWGEVCQNAGSVIEVLVKVHFAALAFVNLTPTPKDNELYAKIYRPIEWIAGVFGLAKQAPHSSRGEKGKSPLDVASSAVAKLFSKRP